ncbi:hypothetical protein CAEBREN_25257 [Caenorhabditis brenneri]|uniref:Uncharacterized protein n=1 Tax=Caenorhabditis brenneri TaxID=135651 RepID=G0NVK5_CAEBE|nr:hypothetical protein CAEBREN_25257 [Caenorhabditis brenneri]
MDKLKSLAEAGMFELHDIYSYLDEKEIRPQETVERIDTLKKVITSAGLQARCKLVRADRNASMDFLMDSTIGLTKELNTIKDGIKECRKSLERHSAKGSRRSSKERGRQVQQDQYAGSFDSRPHGCTEHTVCSANSNMNRILVAGCSMSAKG